MRRYIIIPVIALLIAAAVLVVTAVAFAEPGSQMGEKREGCVSPDCHEGIEDIRAPNTNMYKAIKEAGECTVCHGGDPTVTDDAEAAHAEPFYPDPGSIWIADKTCGQTICHGPEYVYAVKLSLMNTEAGKIQGNLWAWGLQGDHKVRYGNYDLEDTDGQEPIFGTKAYKAYMKELIQMFPDQFPTKLEKLPQPTPEEVKENPALAAFTYLRHDCQRCHVGVPGRMKRGDYRGMGCSACHIPYSNEGLYEGNDPTIPKDEPGHMLVHEIQGDREARGGIPVETCNSCHNRGKRIGMSYQGLMEFPYGTPFDEDGNKQPPLHTKRYLYIKDDHHHDPISRPGNPPGGILCQDCHTSIDVHGDGNIFGTTLAQVEIECTDCHGTPDKYPWELPLGYGEEFGRELPDEPRGVATELPDYQQFGMVYDPEDGYLLSARGNLLGNVVRRGDKAILHSATGRDYEIPLLKAIAQADEWKTPAAKVAMVATAGAVEGTGGKGHMESLECYACHSDWAPQCYGCHVYVDYSEGKEGTDWVMVGNAQRPDGTVDTSLKSPGKIKEGRSYLRWEEPVLGINGEGRVTPIIPGCQVVFSVKGADGEILAHNEIGRTPPNVEGGGPEGQLGIDMAPAFPHTTSRVARSCESCHTNPKALGYGIEGGRFQTRYSEDIVVDLEDPTDPEARIVPQNYQVQIPGIPDLVMDWSQVVDPETGKQMMTVGSHWPGSGPLTAEQRQRAERVGVCMGCHQNMADATFWTDQVIAIYGQISANDDHIKAMNQLIQDAVAGVAAAEDLSEAQAQVQSLQAEVAQTKAKLSETESKLSEAEAKLAAIPPAPNTTLYVVVGLAVGLVVGAGVVFVLRRK